MNRSDVPAIWQHLPFHRGYPVPYFVYWSEQPTGEKVPNFHLADPKKWVVCLKYKKCWVCGRKLSKAAFMITGPKGLTNRVGTDTFMHEGCARETLRWCPHLFYQKTVRRDPYSDDLVINPHHDLEKPNQIALVKTGAFQVLNSGRTYVINYQPLAVQWFEYVEEHLRAKTPALASYSSVSWKRNLGVSISLSTL